MIGRLVYASTNPLGVNLKFKLVPKPNFTFTGAENLPPGARELAKNPDESLRTMVEIGTCVGMSAIWCRNLFQSATEALTKPSDVQSHFVQSRWEQIRLSTNSVVTRLTEFKNFLEGNGLSAGNIQVPARTDFAAPRIFDELTITVGEGTSLVFCPGHCIGIHRVEFENYPGLRSRCYLFDPDRGLYGYDNPADFDQDLAAGYTQNRRYTANADVKWYYLSMG